MIITGYRKRTAGNQLTIRAHIAGLFLLCVMLCETAKPETVLTVTEVRHRALEYNRTYLAAKEEVNKAQSDIIKARAGALPDLRAGGSYSRNFILR